MPEEPSILHSISQLRADTVAFAAIESHLNAFNIFEAVGVTRQEIHHSAFLSFLLDPAGQHGLTDLFLKEFLKLCISNSPPFWCFNLWSTVVERERHRIDVLVQNDQYKFIILIENKTYTAEHSDQLARYLEIVRRRFSTYTIVPVYLTRHGESASHSDYVSVGYGQVADAVERVLTLPQTRDDVRLVMTHYVRMVRKHILEDAELERLCLDTYAKHKRAFDKIMEYVPKHRTPLQELLVDLIHQNDALSAGTILPARYVSFCPRSWIAHVPDVSKDKWSYTNRNLEFWLDINSGGLIIALQIRKGTPEDRQRLFDIAAEHGLPLFNLQTDTVQTQYTHVYMHTIFELGYTDSVSFDELKSDVEEWWEGFSTTDLPRIEQVYLDGLTRPRRSV